MVSTVDALLWLVGSVAEHCDAGGREFDFGRTNTQGLKITE